MLLAVTAGEGQGWIGSWSPGIGDPTFVGWVTVVGYLVASSLCWRQFRRLHEIEGGGDQAGHRSTLATAVSTIARAFVTTRGRLGKLPAQERLRTLWLGLAVVLLLLGINKQLDLQTVVTELGRIAAKAHGWYGSRRPVQLVFIFVVALIGLGVFRAVLLLAQGELRRMRVVLLGTLFLVCFVTIRAASFHHIDRLLGTDIGGFRMNWIIEIGGILLIIVGASRAGQRS